MATANIYGFPNAKASSPRNAFDMSYDTLFNSPAGMLLPAYVEDVKAGDKLKLSAKNFTRTRAVNTAAYMSFSEKVDFFFVPYRLIWSAYNQWRLGNTQARSTTDLNNISRLPYLPSGRWSDLYYTNSDGTMGTSFTSASTGLFGVGEFSYAMRLFDLLGYGLPPIVGIDSINTLTSDIPDYSTKVKSLVDHFQNLNLARRLNYFRIAAFQCIYMYRYRNEDWEPLDASYYNADSLFMKPMYTPADSGVIEPLLASNGNMEPASWTSNVSSYYSLFPEWGSTQPGNANRMTYRKLFTPRFKNWRRDLFTSLKPSGGISTFQLESVLEPQSYNGKYPSNVVVVPSRGSSTFSNLTESDGQGYQPDISSSNYEVNANDVRKLFALDKFSRLAIYSDKNYSSLYEAIFGVKVDEPDVPRYLGTISSDITISEVVATSAGTDGTSDASTSVLGELAGKGIGSNESEVFDADFKEDGIVMGIHYIMPFNYYAPYRINPFTSKMSKYDYYYPSFDGLGLSPVFSGELGYWQGVGTVPHTSTSNYAEVLGFNTRYHEYKQRTNEIHGSFAPGQSDSHWTLTVGSLYGTNPAYRTKINPSCTDSIFGVNFDGSPATDPFQCFYHFTVTKVSNMEAIGIPNT